MIGKSEVYAAAVRMHDNARTVPRSPPFFDPEEKLVAPVEVHVGLEALSMKPLIIINEALLKEWAEGEKDGFSVGSFIEARWKRNFSGLTLGEFPVVVSACGPMEPPEYSIQISSSDVLVGS